MAVTRGGFALGRSKPMLLIAAAVVSFFCCAQLYLSTSIYYEAVSEEEIIDDEVAQIHVTVQQQQQQQASATTVPSFLVKFLPPNALVGDDIFAASWWQTIERFIPLDIEKIANVEGDAFKPVLTVGRGRKDVRMAVDWLDFSIEHLSKWWKLPGPKIYPYAIQKLGEYVQKTLNSSVSFSAQHDQRPMNNTLALVPLGVTGDEALWEISLTATLASLLRQGIGRVVVVGYYDADVRLARQVFENLRGYYIDPSNIVNGTSKNAISVHLGNATELAYVHTDDVNSTHIRFNVPKGALKGLQEVLLGKRPKDAADWLGSSSWKYLYFTESDQILNARLSPEFFQLLDEERVIIPHRLQPIPHWEDLQDWLPNSTARMIPQSSNMTVYDLIPAETHACCDTGPKRPARPEWCYIFWWQRGFGSKEGFPNGRFDYLSTYECVRFSTGIVHLAATERGRRCTPKKRGECNVIAK